MTVLADDQFEQGSCRILLKCAVAGMRAVCAVHTVGTPFQIQMVYFCGALRLSFSAELLLRISLAGLAPVLFATSPAGFLCGVSALLLRYTFCVFLQCFVMSSFKYFSILFRLGIAEWPTSRSISKLSSRFVKRLI